MRRASPKIRVPDFDFVGVAAAQSKPAETAAISLSESTVTWSGGSATPVNAVLPDKHLYQKVRFVVAAIDQTAGGGGDGITGSPTDVEITVWERTPDGEMVSAGVAVLQADGSFSDVEVDNHDARYAVSLSTLAGGTTPTVNAAVWVQGLHTPTFIASN